MSNLKTAKTNLSPNHIAATTARRRILFGRLPVVALSLVSFSMPSYAATLLSSFQQSVGGYEGRAEPQPAAPTTRQNFSGPDISVSASAAAEVQPQPQSQPARQRLQESGNDGGDARPRIPYQSDRENRPNRESRVRQGTAAPSVKPGQGNPAPLQGGTDTPIPAPSPNVMVSTAPKWDASLQLSWYNKYYFRGVDVLKAVSRDEGSGGVANAFLQFAYKRPGKDGFSIGISQYQALSRQLPNGPSSTQNPNKKGQKTEDFSLPPSDRYGELNIQLAYISSLDQIWNKLSGFYGTVGFNHYHFSDNRWYESGGKSISFANEATLKLEYKNLPFVTPSISWAHDFDAFKGDFLEVNLDGAPLAIAKGVTITPHIGLSYDISYNAPDGNRENGWNSLEFGASMPIRINDSTSLLLSANYVKSLSDTSDDDGDVSRTVSGFWGGVSVVTSWGGSAEAKDMATQVKLGEMDIIKPPTGKWEVSTGMGWRQMSASFEHGNIPAFDTSSIYQRKVQKGQLGLAQPGRNTVYDDGEVFGKSPINSAQGDAATPNKSGLVHFRYNNQTQLRGSSENGNAQIQYHTTVYNYRNSTSTPSVKSEDEDSIVHPYFKVNREIWRSPDNHSSLRIGALYSYSHAEMDSGVQLARVDSLVEQASTFGYAYALDDVATLGFKNSAKFDSRRFNGGTNFTAVVINAIDYTKNYQTSADRDKLLASGPQVSFVGTETEVARVATFVRTRLDVDANDVAIPITLRHDFGRRLHAEFSVAPTATFVSAEYGTTLYQGGSDRAESKKYQARTIKGLAKGTQGVGVPTEEDGDFVELPAPTDVITGNDKSGTPDAPTRNPVKEQTASGPAGGGGKGGYKLKQPTIPGDPINVRHFSNNSTDVVFGITAAASVLLDFNDEGTSFAEFWSRYRWSQSLTIGNALGSSKLDLSGIEFGIGLGFRFN